MASAEASDNVDAWLMSVPRKAWDRGTPLELLSSAVQDLAGDLTGAEWAVGVPVDGTVARFASSAGFTLVAGSTGFSARAAIELPTVAVDALLERGLTWHAGHQCALPVAVGGSVKAVVVLSFADPPATELLGDLALVLYAFVAVMSQRLMASLGPDRINAGDFNLEALWRSGPQRLALLSLDLRQSTALTDALGRINAHDVRHWGVTGDNARVAPNEMPIPPPHEVIGEFLDATAKPVCRLGRIEGLRGDGFFAVFDPHGHVWYPEEDRGEEICQCLRATCAACEAASAMDTLLSKWHGPAGWYREFQRRHNQHLDLGVGIGIDFGPVVAGFYGPEWRQDFATVGDHANTAARFSDAANKPDPDTGKRRGKILVSQTVAARLMDANRQGARPAVTLVEERPLTVRGKEGPQACFRVEAVDRKACWRVARCSQCRRE